MTSVRSYRFQWSRVRKCTFLSTQLLPGNGHHCMRSHWLRRMSLHHQLLVLEPSCPAETSHEQGVHQCPIVQALSSTLWLVFMNDIFRSLTVSYCTYGDLLDALRLLYCNENYYPKGHTRHEAMAHSLRIRLSKAHSQCHTGSNSGVDPRGSRPGPWPAGEGVGVSLRSSVVIGVLTPPGHVLIDRLCRKTTSSSKVAHPIVNIQGADYPKISVLLIWLFFFLKTQSFLTRVYVLRYESLIVFIYLYPMISIILCFWAMKKIDFLPLALKLMSHYKCKQCPAMLLTKVGVEN
jgi:hypothetical protein